jgi:hypothetical protein
MDAAAFFIVHPLNAQADVTRKYPRRARPLPMTAIRSLLRHQSPLC